MTVASGVNDFAHPHELEKLLRLRVKKNCRRLIAIKMIKCSTSSDNEYDISRILNNGNEKGDSEPVFR